MSVIADFLVRLGYDLDKQSQKTAENGFEKIKDAVNGINEKLEGLKSTFIGVASVWAGSKILSYVTSTADKFDELGQKAALLGEKSPEQLASLQSAFSSAGVEVDTLNDSLANMTDYIGQAMLGEGEGVEVFKQLGINIKDSNGHARDTLDIFDEMHDKLSRLDHATRVATINKIGLDTELIKGFSLSRDELDKLRQEYIASYSQAGVSIDDAVKKSQAFKTSISNLQSAFSLITEVVGVQFLGTATQAFEDLTKYVSLNMSKLTLILSSIIKVLSSIAKAVIALGKTIFDIVSRVIDWFINASTLFKGAIGLIGGMTAALLLFNSAFMKSPLGRLIAIATAIGLLIDDFKVWQEGGNSLIGSWLGSFDKIYNILSDLPPAFSWLNTAFQAVIGNVDKLLLALVGLPLGFKVFSKIVPFIAGPFGAIAKIATGTLSIFTRLGLLLGGAIAKGALLLGASLSKLSIFIAGAAKAASVMMLSLVKLGAAFLATPIGWLIAGIAALVTAGILLYKNWDKVSSFFAGIWQAIAGYFDSAIASIKETLASLGISWDALASVFSAGASFVTSIWDALGAAWDAVSNGISQGLSSLGEVFSGFATFLGAVTSAIAAPWKSLFAWFTNKFQWFADKVNAVKSGFNTVVSKVKGWFGDDDDEDAPEQATPEQVTPEQATPKALMRGFIQAQSTPQNESNSPQISMPMIGGVPMQQALINGANNFAMPVYQPKASAAAPLAQKPSNITQNNGDTTIIIQADKSPQRTAEAIAAKQSEIQADAARNLRRNVF